MGMKRSALHFASGKPVFLIALAEPAQAASSGGSGLPAWFWAIVLVGLIVLAVAAALGAGAANKTKEPPKAAGPAGQEQANETLLLTPEAGQRLSLPPEPSVWVQLSITTGGAAEQAVEKGLTSSLLVGRAEECDVCIDDAKLSRRHFVIEKDGEDLYITDLHSRNGTMLNGIRVVDRQKLTNGDKIWAGLSDIVFSRTGR